MTARVIRQPESLAALLHRIDVDSRSVGEPVTWAQLAEAAESVGWRHKERGKDIAGLGQTLRRAHLNRQHVGPRPVDWHGIALVVEGHGWILKGRRAA